MRAPTFWGFSRPNLAALALSPLGALYGAAAARRMGQAGTRLPAPVICVGNFTVGGAGKTPTALAIARILILRGERVAFLSRGYGGERRAGPLRVDPALHSARAVGDEPLLLAATAPCYVCADRVAAGRLAIADGATVLVMDDGLQNPSLEKDFRIGVVDGETGFGNGLCFPAGPLRAPLKTQLSHVDAFVVVGGEGPRGLGREKPRFLAHLRPDAIAAAPLVGRSVLAFAGIARPEKFFATLERLGARIAIRRALCRPSSVQQPRNSGADNRGGAPHARVGHDREGPCPRRRAAARPDFGAAGDVGVR